MNNHVNVGFFAFQQFIYGFVLHILILRGANILLNKIPKK